MRNARPNAVAQSGGELYSIMHVSILLLFLTIHIIQLGTAKSRESFRSLPNLCPESEVCKCTQNVEMMDINCLGVTDIAQVQHLLQKHFTNITINKLYIKKGFVTAIPSRGFENLTIRTIFLECPIEEIDDYAFEGLNGLNYLKLYFTKFVTIPPAISNATELVTLVIENGELQSLDLELQNLMELLYLSLKNNSIANLSSNALTNLAHIERLDLSFNKIAFIDPNALDSMRNLKFLFLRFNRIVSADGLFKNLNPTVIDFHSNRLTSVNSVFPYGMWAVTEVYLGSNPLCNISSDAFSGRIPNVKLLDLRNSNLTYLNPNLFQSTSRLVTLYLSYNRMISLPKDSFQHLVGLQILELNRNNIVSIQGLFESVPEMSKLTLSYNRIEILADNLQQMKKLKKLYLNGNRITYITRENFYHLSQLETLDLSNNSIYYVEKDSFSMFPNLQMLVLTENQIESLNHSVHSSPSLSKLYMNLNKIQVIDEAELTGLPNLQSIFLYGNKAHSINGAFASLPLLEELKLNNNQLTSLSRDSLTNPIHLKTLSLDDSNPWACDCRILWMLDWLSQTNFTILKDEPVCQSPERLHRKAFKQLTRKDLTNWPESCPDSCSCSCEPQQRDFYISADCSCKNLTSLPEAFSPHLGKLDMSGNLLKTVTSFANITTNYIWYLNLEDNWISSINAEFPTSLQTLLLSGNNLTRFDHNVLNNKSLEHISLSRNPWKCDCQTVSFRRWLLSENKVVYDLNNTRCGLNQENNDLSNKVIVFLTETDLCPPKLALYISISVGVLVSLLVLTSLMLTYTRNQLSIKVWMYAHGFTWVKEEDLDTDKEFDAFISYSSYDEEFVVRQFISGIKSRLPEIYLCTHHLFPVGEFIQTNIFNAVQASKRTILILSENFIESSWCMMEFRAAYTQALEDKIHRLLVVRYGDISQACEIDPTLQTYLDSTTYLKWGEKHFWEKLLYALPKKKVRKSKKHANMSVNSERSPLLIPQ